MIALGKNVLIKRDPVIRSQSGLLLPDNETYRECMASVLSLGDIARDYCDVKIGSRIHYDPNGLLDFAFGEDPDLALIDVGAINAEILE